MEILSPVIGPIRDALAIIRSKSFPGIPASDADMFELGYWAGVMAVGIVLVDETASDSEIAERVEAELKRLEEADDAPGDEGPAKR